jgi:hypothetical protein
MPSRATIAKCKKKGGRKGINEHDWGCKMFMSKEDGGEGDELCFEEKPTRERGVGRRGWVRTSTSWRGSRMTVARQEK